MMNTLRTWLTLALVALLTACAHPISLTSDLKPLDEAKTSPVNKKAGYFVAAEDKAREVVSPGGGGDKVSYFPYRDLEVGLYTVFSRSFSDVVKLSSKDDARVQSEQLSYVLVPKIVTSSWSDSAFTWPPTVFSIELEVAVNAPDGKLLTTVSAKGEGRAEFSEFKSDFSLSARRAATAALLKLKTALADALARMN